MMIGFWIGVVLIGEGNPPLRKLPAPLSEFFITGHYHNCATLGPAARETLDKTMKDWADLESDPADKYFGMFQNGSSYVAKDELVRRRVATYIGAALDEVTLVPSTTIGLNSVATGVFPLLDSGHIQRLARRRMLCSLAVRCLAGWLTWIVGVPISGRTSLISTLTPTRTIP